MLAAYESSAEPVGRLHFDRRVHFLLNGLDLARISVDNSTSGAQKVQLSGQSLDEQMTRNWFEMQAFQ